MPAQRPNLLLIIVDDQQHDTLSALGHPVARTPHLDQLVARGTAMTDAHLMGSTIPAVCAPSRAMLHTGRSLFHLDNCEQPQQLGLRDMLLPRWLHEHGYRTHAVGKWHNAKPAFTRCFDTGEALFLGGMHDPFATPTHRYDAACDPDAFEPEPLEPGRHATDHFADAACRFLDAQHGATDPFMLYVAFTSPHDPRRTHQHLHDLFDPADIPLPPNVLPQHPFDNGELRIRDEMLAAFPRDEAELRRHIADYHAMIHHHDQAIGRILDALQRSGRLDDTIVVFTADHGLGLGQHGLMGKQNLYEHSNRVPLVLAGPGIPPGQRRDGQVYLMDLCPTLCDLLHLPVPDSVEADSFQPMLSDPTRPGRAVLFSAYRQQQRAARAWPWKLIRYDVGGSTREQLFNLAQDAWEMQDRVDDPTCRDQLHRLRDLLAAERRRWDDPAVRS